MANDLNQCNFIGRLGQDPECRYTPDGNAVANIRIAVGWKSRNAEGTEWVRVVFFGRIAEIAAEYLKKGSKIFITGRMRTREWEKDGEKRYTTEIVASEMQMLDGKPEGQGGSKAGNQGRGVPQDSRQPQPQPEPNLDFDDDIPF